MKRSFPATYPLIPSRFLVSIVLALILMMGVYSFPSAYAQRAGLGGPQTWHVSVGGQSPDGAVQGEAYYPHVITIDVGDIVVWSLSSGEPHTVTFFGTGPLPDICAAASDFSPCPLPLPSPYNGTSFVGSGLMLPTGFNWDNNFPLPHGNQTFALTFGNPGAYIYQSVVQAGMQGVVIVHATGTPYPFTQKEYSAQAQQQLNGDLTAARQALASFRQPETTTGPDNTVIHYVAAGVDAPETTTHSLAPTGGSSVTGTASLAVSVSSISSTLSVKVSLSGLTPGQSYSPAINYGVCGTIAQTSPFLLGPFTVNSITAGADGTGQSSTEITTPVSGNGIQNIRIQSSGWFVSVTQAVGEAGANQVACGNLVFHNTEVMRFVPGTVRVHSGDTVVWRAPVISVPFIIFPAGQPVPPFPDFAFAGPTGNATTYDGTTFFNSGGLFQEQTFVLTFTAPGSFQYVDPLEPGMFGTVIVQANHPNDQFQGV